MRNLSNQEASKMDDEEWKEYLESLKNEQRKEDKSNLDKLKKKLEITPQFLIEIRAIKDKIGGDGFVYLPPSAEIEPVVVSGVRLGLWKKIGKVVLSGGFLKETIWRITGLGEAALALQPTEGETIEQLAKKIEEKLL